MKASGGGGKNLANNANSGPLEKSGSEQGAPYGCQAGQFSVGLLAALQEACCCLGPAKGLCESAGGQSAGLCRSFGRARAHQKTGSSHRQTVVDCRGATIRGATMRIGLHLFRLLTCG